MTAAAYAPKPETDSVKGSSGSAVRARDGRRLSFDRAGCGPHVVVLEAGMGASSSSWRPTFEALAKQATVIAYDRAGLGDSEADRSPRTLERLVADLEDLLDALGVGPVVLVGHSYGGLVVRALTVKRPDLVAGVILLDPTDETAALFRSRPVRFANVAAYSVMSALARLGVLYRLQLRGDGAKLIDKACVGLDEAGRIAFAREFFSARAMRAAKAEMRQLPGALDSLPISTRRLAVPHTVISGGRASQRQQGMRQEILAVHAEFCAGSGGRHVIAADSGHYVPIECPDLVVEEVMRVAALTVADGDES